jgi:hypothetical protein
MSTLPLLPRFADVVTCNCAFESLLSKSLYTSLPPCSRTNGRRFPCEIDELHGSAQEAEWLPL